jgi:hypothetical protein
MMISMSDDRLTDVELDALERQIPEVAKTATMTAHARALTMNDSVLSVHAGNLVRVFADGSKTFIAEAKPRRRVTIGEVVQVRRSGGKATDKSA